MRCAVRPSLSLREKEGKNFLNPLSAAGEERVVERSNDRVSKYASDIFESFT
jgi:hypothetical protein